jgi:hypothetical protein
MTQSKQPAPACRVVTQYYSGGEKIYELASPNATLELRVSSRALDGGVRTWHVAAQSGNANDAVTISDEAENKRDALSKVAAQWTAQAGELGLPSFDWTAVESALLAVRGI